VLQLPFNNLNFVLGIEISVLLAEDEIFLII
jgi:hypothetical protein